MRLCSIAALVAVRAAALQPVRRLQPLRSSHCRASSAKASEPARRGLGDRVGREPAWSLGTYKPERIAHNAVGMAQALTALPLVAAAAQAPDDRRLALAWAAASAWSVACVVFAPAVTRAFVRGTSHPVRYPPALAALAIGLHVFAGVGATRSWRRAGGTPDTASGVLRGVAPVEDVSSTAAVELAFAPARSPSSPPARSRRRSPRDAAESPGQADGARVRRLVAAGRRGVPLAAGRERRRRASLKRGLRAHALAHVALAAARPFVDGMGLYPAATACAPAWAATLARVRRFVGRGKRRC